MSTQPSLPFERDVLLPRRPAIAVQRVSLENYRSIARCDVQLGPVTFLVGPNGSGKSNFVDAIRFIGDAVRANSFTKALNARGGWKEVRRRSRSKPYDVCIRLDLEIALGRSARFSVVLGGASDAGYVVKREACAIDEHHYEVSQGRVVTSSLAAPPPAAPERPYLVNVAGLPGFASVHGLLLRIGFYNLVPDRMRELQPSDGGDELLRDGSNVASVLRRMQEDALPTKQRIEEFLRVVVPGVEGVDAVTVRDRESFEVRQGTDAGTWVFPASSVSDGTVRALGVLVALFHRVPSGELDASSSLGLVCLEEPEMALHPAAADAIRGAILEASRTTQVLVTSHSPELLDTPTLSDTTLRAVAMANGETQIGRLDLAGREALRTRLYTAGELLRIGELRPDAESVQGKQGDLFERDGE